MGLVAVKSPDRKLTLNNRFILASYVAAIILGLVTARYVYLKGDYSRLADVALVWALAYGVYRRSRTCAILLFLYRLGDMAFRFQQTHNWSVLFGITELAYTIAIFLGIIGTFSYRASKKQDPQFGVNAL